MVPKKNAMRYMELVFDFLYLVSCLIFAIILLTNTVPFKQTWGLMALVLVFGDSFHLVPRILTIISGNSLKYIKSLGYGKMMTSITMSIFYLILWLILKNQFALAKTFYDVLVYSLVIIRIILSVLKQNDWANGGYNLKFGIIRNIPFVLQGLLMIVLFIQNLDLSPYFLGLSIAIIISFLCYLPVVLLANNNKKIGMLMLPKTVAYLYIVIIGLYI